MAAFVAVAASVLMTWPLAARAGHYVLRAIYFWDAYTNAMIMGSRVDAAVGRAPLSLYDNYFFAPLPNSIAFNENLFGLSLLFAPFHLISNNPLWAYNVTLLLSLALSVFFTYLLVRRLTGSGPAGLVAGVAFAFCPYVFFELGRIQLVATQWIPACFLFLHRAIEEKRPRDIVGFWVCILLQIGTGLYYTMFLVPLLGLVGGALLVKHRPSRRFYYWFAACAVCSGVVALLMVKPYFSARHAFNLERSLSFASSYDGKLGFFANVYETNRTLTGLHHEGERRGAPEEIAFPGFSALLLSLVALAVPAWRSLQRAGTRQASLTLLKWSALVVVTSLVTLLNHSMLPGALVFGAGAWYLVRRGEAHPFGGTRGLYFAVLVLSVVMFLGLSPLTWDGAPVRGLYYYFHTYFPGFNGIRKVSRQAVMTTFAVCLLGGFGGAWLLSRLRRKGDRLLATGLALAAICFELRSFPHPIESVWAGDRGAGSLALRGLATCRRPGGFRASKHGPADLPRRRGDGVPQLPRALPRASLRQRTVELAAPGHGACSASARRATRRRSAASASVDGHAPRHRVRGRSQARERGARRRAQRAARRVSPHLPAGPHSVFTLLGENDPTLALLVPPALPAPARRIPAGELRARAPLQPDRARLALDGKEGTYWTAGRLQRRDQYFEVELADARPIVALEITAPGRVMDVPVSYRLSAARGDEDLGTLLEQPVLRFYRDQIYSPETFVFRLLLPAGVTADRIRLTVEQAVPGHYFSIGELRLYTTGNESSD